MRFYTLIGSMCFVLISCAQSSDWDKVEIKTNKLTNSVAMLVGAGGNIGVISSGDHTLIIDAQFEPIYDKIKIAIQDFTTTPVTYLINTHWHGDHTGGNNKFALDGATIIAHENVKVRLSSDQRVAYFGKEVPAALDEARPKLTFNDRFSMQVGEEIVNIYHIPNAHTDGDALVHCETSNVIHLGDTYFSGMYPFLDLSSGGNIKGIIKACEFALSLADETTQIIPGHGPLSSKADLMRYTSMLTAITNSVAKAKKEGLDLKEIVASNPTSEFDEEFNTGFIKPKDLISFIYNSLD